MNNGVSISLSKDNNFIKVEIVNEKFTNRVRLGFTIMENPEYWTCVVTGTDELVRTEMRKQGHVLMEFCNVKLSGIGYEIFIVNNFSTYEINIVEK